MLWNLHQDLEHGQQCHSPAEPDRTGIGRICAGWQRPYRSIARKNAFQAHDLKSPVLRQLGLLAIRSNMPTVDQLQSSISLELQACGPNTLGFLIPMVYVRLQGGVMLHKSKQNGAPPWKPKFESWRLHAITHLIFKIAYYIVGHFVDGAL